MLARFQLLVSIRELSQSKNNVVCVAFSVAAGCEKTPRLALKPNALELLGATRGWTAS